jgi:methionine sulfoxide reductase heme-binding subunit
MQQRRAAGLSNGWPFVGVAAVAVLALVLAAIAITPDPGDAAARAVRVTARTSVVLFLMAFTAAALFRLWPNAWTRWQRRNRRYLGVSFAFSHGVHLVAILWLQHVRPVEFAASVSVVTWIGGGLAYVFIAAMTATSFDRTAQMLGPRAWKILHTVGSYYVWLIFANSYIGRALEMPEYIPAAGFVVLALGLRIAARVADRRAVQPATAN